MTMLPTPELKAFGEQITQEYGIWVVSFTLCSSARWYALSTDMHHHRFVNAPAEAPTYHRQSRNGEVLQPKRTGGRYIRFHSQT